MVQEPAHFSCVTDPPTKGYNLPPPPTAPSNGGCIGFDWGVATRPAAIFLGGRRRRAGLTEPRGGRPVGASCARREAREARGGVWRGIGGMEGGGEVRPRRGRPLRFKIFSPP